MTYPTKIKKGDLILATLRADKEGGKETQVVVQITKVLESSVLGFLVRKSHFNQIQVEIQHADICFNMGPTPPNITVAGVNFDERFTHQTEHKRWGTLHWSFDPDAEEGVKERVHKAYSITYAFLKENGLASITELPLIHEIHHKAVGKWVGRYTGSTNLAHLPGVVRFTPLHPKSESIEHPGYTVAHEIGHVIEAQLLHTSPKLRAKWLALYDETVSPVHIDKDILADLLEKLKASENLKGYRAAVATDESLMEPAKEIFIYLKRAHGLFPHDVGAFLEAETPEALDHYWPKSSACFTQRLTPSVSQYATKNVRELFAEAFAFKVCGKKLPKAVSELMDASLQRALKQLPRVLQDIADSNLGASGG